MKYLLLFLLTPILYGEPSKPKLLLSWEYDITEEVQPHGFIIQIGTPAGPDEEQTFTREILLINPTYASDPDIYDRFPPFTLPCERSYINPSEYSFAVGEIENGDYVTQISGILYEESGEYVSGDPSDIIAYRGYTISVTESDELGGWKHSFSKSFIDQFPEAHRKFFQIQFHENNN